MSPGQPSADPALAHRPWPLPAGPWIGFQRWSDLLFAHWRVPVEALRPRLPERLEIDAFDGEAWIAAVPFRMERVRPRWMPPLPGLSWFPELNLRTYVRLDDRPGVFFFSLDASNRIAVRLARRGFHLPYLDARIEWERRGDGIVYRSERTHAGVPPARFEAEYGPAGEVFHARPGTLEHFLTERYCLYASPESVARVDRVGGSSAALCRAEVHHAPWPLRPARATVDAGELLEGAGFPGAAEAAPHLLFARSIDVRVWPLRRV